MRKKVAENDVKEPVKIRLKELKSGNKSIYLDCYVNGVREYKFLNLYLRPEVTREDKKWNKEQMQLANAIKAQYIIDIQNGEFGFKDRNRTRKLNFISYCEDMAAQYEAKGQTSCAVLMRSAILRMVRYKGKNISFNHVTKEFLIGYIEFLNSETRDFDKDCKDADRKPKPLSEVYKEALFARIMVALNQAERDGIIIKNPGKDIDRKLKPHSEQKSRCFLTLEEVKKIIDLRIKIANILGYETYAAYALEDRMSKDKKTVDEFIMELLKPSMPFANKDVADVFEYAKKNGFEGDQLLSWDFTYWSERYKEAEYSLSSEELKPYFQLESCIDAVFGLASRLYGITFEERNDVPVYHQDVKVYEVKDADGSHLALFYADFFPRASKRGGAWMTDFRGQSVRDGVEYRPFVTIVCNFTKPTADAPALITHDELTTFLHEFGHALHGILAKGRYPSLTGTSVSRDFVELPSQIMENWAYEPEYLNSFAKHYQTGESIPAELIEKIVAAKNYLAGYAQVRQLHFGYLDMAWHSLTEVPAVSTIEFEQNVLAPYAVLPAVEGAAFSTSFSHIFAGGYSAGYYSYKWAEVLEADAFSLFKEKGIFNTEVANSFRTNILEKGGSEDEAVIYRNFRGHDPEPEALMKKLGLVK